MTDSSSHLPDLPDHPGISPQRAPIEGLEQRIDPVAARVDHAEQQLGLSPLIDEATRMLLGQLDPDEDTHHLELVGGMPLVEGWMARVWAGQVLLHRWHHQAERAVLAGLADEKWQVRAVCAEVAGARELTSAAEQLHRLLSDAAPQVRSAAALALGATGSAHDAGLLDSLNGAMMSPDSVFADAAEQALEQLAQRFNRPDVRPSTQY